MYSPSQIYRGLARGVANRGYFGRELNRLYHRRLYTREWNDGGIDVFAEDWDTLVVLDACRYDTFARHHGLPGRLERRESRGSHTAEFLAGNFAGRELLDTVYVTASPQFHRRRDDLGTRFHAVVDVWRGDGWDDDHGTVLPETMTEAALRAAEDYPDKRLLVHYMQPHYPFVEDDLAIDTSFADGADGDVWARLNRGEADVDAETVRAAYRRNLERALPAVEELMAAMEGLTVVTSDHGNMFGERARPIPVREWGHPPGLHTEQLVAVPWLAHRRGERRAVRAEAAAEAAGDDDEGGDADDIDDETVEDRLRHLGYAE